MLGIRRVGWDRADYYLSDLGRELPVAVGLDGADPRPGRWIGSAGAALGLTGGLEPAGFRSLLGGRHPHTGRPMPSVPTTTPSSASRVCGFDLTFSVPKSVSVLFALGGEEVAKRVVDVHGAAVEEAVRYLEGHGVAATRRRGPEREVVATTGLIGGVFTHGVNRNLDPHLHSHVVVANLVHGVDGRWSACDWRGLAAHQPAAAAVYEAHLRAGLTAEVGVRWDRGMRANDGWVAPAGARAAEIVGVPPELLGEFSSRSAEIRQGVHARGARTARGRHIVWASTRAPKASAPYDSLVEEWGRRARAAGEPLDVGRLSGPSIAPPSQRVLDEHRYAAVIASTPHGGVRRRDVVVAVGTAAPDGVLAPSLARVVGRWAPGDGSVGVAEPLHPRRTVVPANHVLRELGPRPTDAGAHDVWMDAAEAIEAYRARWGVGHAEEALGPVKSMAALPASRLADHVRTARHVEAARARLGVRAPVEVELGRGL